MSKILFLKLNVQLNREEVIYTILINGYWEDIQDLDDVFRVVDEKVGRELANEIKIICSKPHQELQDEISNLESIIEDLELQTCDYDSISDNFEYLNGQLIKLKKYIEENADETDFMKGMQKALNMIM